MQDVSPALSTVPLRNFSLFLEVCEAAGAQEGALQRARSFLADPPAGRPATGRHQRRRAPRTVPNHLDAADTPTCASLLCEVLSTVPPPADGDDDELATRVVTRAGGTEAQRRLGSLLGASATCAPSREPIIHAPRVPQDLAAMLGVDGHPGVLEVRSGTEGPGAGDGDGPEDGSSGVGRARSEPRGAPDPGGPTQVERPTRGGRRSGSTLPRSGRAAGPVQRLVSVTVRVEFKVDAAALVALAALAISPEKSLPLARLLGSAREVLDRFPLRGLKGRVVVGVVLHPEARNPARTETAEAPTPWMSPERVWRLASGTPLPSALLALSEPPFGSPTLALAPLATWLAGLLVAAQEPERPLPHLSPDLTIQLPSAVVAAAFLRGILLVRPRDTGPGVSSPARPGTRFDRRLVFVVEHLVEGRDVDLWPALRGLIAHHGGSLDQLRRTDATAFEWLISRVQHEIYKKLRSFDPERAPPSYLGTIASQAFLAALYGGKLPASFLRAEAAGHLPGIPLKARAIHVQASKITGTDLERLWRSDGLILPEHQALLRLLHGQSLHAYVLATLRSQLVLTAGEPMDEDGDSDPEEAESCTNARAVASRHEVAQVFRDAQRRGGAATGRPAVAAGDHYLPEGDLVQYCRDWQRFEWGYGQFAREAFPTEKEALARLTEAQDLCQVCLERLRARRSHGGLRGERPEEWREGQEKRLRALLEREGVSRRLGDLNRAELKELAHTLGLSVNRPATAVDAIYVGALLYPDGQVAGGETATMGAQGESDEPTHGSAGTAPRAARRSRRGGPRARRPDAD